MPESAVATPVPPAATPRERAWTRTAEYLAAELVWSEGEIYRLDALVKALTAQIADMALERYGLGALADRWLRERGDVQRENDRLRHSDAAQRAIEEESAP